MLDVWLINVYHTLLKIKAIKVGFHSNAIDEPFLVPEKNSEQFLKEPFSLNS